MKKQINRQKNIKGEIVLKKGLPVRRTIEVYVWQ